MPNRPGSQLCRPAIEPPFGFVAIAGTCLDDADAGDGIAAAATAAGAAIALWFII